MKFFSSLTLAGLALAAMPAFGDNIKLDVTTNVLLGSPQTFETVGVDSLSYSGHYPGLNPVQPAYDVTANVDFGGSTFMYTLTGSVDIIAGPNADLADPFIEADITANLDIPEIVGGYRVVGHEFTIDAAGNGGITSISYIVNGPTISFPIMLSTTRWDDTQTHTQGFSYMDFQLQINHIDPEVILVDPDPAATPEPASFALMLLPMLAAFGFKLRSKFRLQWL